MSTKRLRPSAAVAAATALALSGLLSGCGVAGTDFNPGIAASVGDETVTVNHVNQTTASYCSAVKSQLASGNQILPLRFLSAGITGQLALVEAAKQLASETGVKAGATYTAKVAQLEQTTEALPQDQQDAVTEVESSATYVEAVELAVGTQELQARGVDSPRPARAAAAGKRTFLAWLDDHDVQIDPKYGIEIKDGAIASADTNITVAVGDTAKKGAAEQPDPVWAASLPSNTRCG